MDPQGANKPTLGANVAQKTNKKSFELNSQWTAQSAIKGWRHYRITRIFYEEKEKTLELTGVCDNSVKVIAKQTELKSDDNWLPGWK